MVRVLIEISLPARSLAQVRQVLSPGELPPGVTGYLEVRGDGGGCGGLATGGAPAWSPCYLSLQCPDRRHAGLAAAMETLREALVTASRQGGAEVFAVPAAVQVDDAYLRVRDVAEVLNLLAGAN